MSVRKIVAQAVFAVASMSLAVPIRTSMAGKHIWRNPMNKGVRVMRRLACVSVVSLLLASLAMGATAAAKAQKVTISMTEFKFSPSSIVLQAGVPVELTLVNQGRTGHDLMVYASPKAPPDDWDDYAMTASYFRDAGEVQATFKGQGHVSGTRIFEFYLDAHQSAVVSFTPVTKGTFEIGCHLSGHYEAGMKGTWEVK